MNARGLTLSLVIPVYNEEERLPRTFKALKQFSQHHPFKQVEVIFVNDGSRDDTQVILERYYRTERCRLISYPGNQGKGFALRQGLAVASGDYCFFLDADMSTPLSEIEKFLPHLEDGCPVIIGTRKAKGAKVVIAQPWYRQKMGQVYTWLAALITGAQVSDFTCGFKCLSRAAVQTIVARALINRWSYDAEFLFLAHRHGFRICEVPVTWYNDPATAVRLFQDTLSSFIDLVRIRLIHRQER